MSLLKVQNLTTYYDTSAGYNQALESISFDLNSNEILGLIGESGCGKSTAGYSLMRMVERPGQIMGGSVLIDGLDLLTVDNATHRKLLWKEIAMIPQSAMNALDPCYKIGAQILEALKIHFPQMSKEEGMNRVHSLLEMVGLNSRIAQTYPHKLSGGMKQRAVIAMALACDPKVIISDEATTGLDVLIEAQILAILRRLKKERGLGIIIISHDLRMVTTVCDRIGIMYAGYLVEIGSTDEIKHNAQHPYTKALFSSQIDMNDFNRRVDSIEGVVPKSINPDDLCRFFSRCKEKVDVCNTPPPGFTSISPTHAVACFKEVLASGK